VSLIAIYRLDANAIAYEPYPDITWPSVSLAAIAAIALLLAPLFAPVERPKGGS
jgi:hypothetical protein